MKHAHRLIEPFEHNTLGNLQGGNPENSEYYHLTKEDHDDVLEIIEAGTNTDIIVNHNDLQGIQGGKTDSSDKVTEAYHLTHAELSHIQAFLDNYDSNGILDLFSELEAEYNQLTAAHNELTTAHNALSTAHSELVTEHNELVTAHNELVTAHSELEAAYNLLGSSFDDQLNCVGIEFEDGAWFNIDESGNWLNSNIVKQSPCLRNIRAVTVDGQAMVRIPKFYFLYQQTSTGHRWWISNHSFEIAGVGTAQVHKGFIYSGVEKDAFQVGAYEASKDTSASNKAASVVGALPWIGEVFANFITYCQNRGNGFDMLNYWQWSAIQMLCLIDAGSADVEQAIGQGNTTSGAAVACGESNAVWRGIHELWGNAGCACQGLQMTGGTYQLWTDAGNSTYIDTGLVAPVTISSKHDRTTSIKTIHSDLAAQGLFLPETLGDSPNFGHDSLWHKGVGYVNARVGGCYDDTPNYNIYGIFQLGSLQTAAFKQNNMGTRLVRVL